MSLQIVRIAAGTTFQDRGRPGWRQYGVPPGGAFDRESHELALQLVGRSDGETLEIPIPGGELVATRADRLSLVGGGLSAKVDAREIELHTAFDVAAGSTLTLSPIESGLRTYLASAQGWNVNLVLGSVSGVVPSGELFSSERQLSAKLVGSRRPVSIQERAIRIVCGPQARDADLERMRETAFKVSLQSNRVGIRLVGGDFDPVEEYPSEPSCVGAVQLAPSGELLIHGPDGPTVAGYPKIAVVADVDRDRLAQLRPLQEVRFEIISLEAARQLTGEKLQGDLAPNEAPIPSSNQ